MLQCSSSNRDLREDSDDRHLNVLLSAVDPVLVTKPDERECGEEQIERVMLLASSFPGRDLGGVSFSVVEIDSSVKPMPIVINMIIVESSELVHRMVLQVVNLDHLILSRLTFILVSLNITVLRVFKWLGGSVVCLVKIFNLSASGDCVSLNTNLSAS